MLVTCAIFVYFCDFAHAKSLYSIPDHYAQPNFDTKNYDFYADFESEKSVYIFSVGGEGFLNFYTAKIGERVHLEDMPSNAAPFYIWEDNENGGLILGTQDFTTEPSSSKALMLTHDIGSNNLSVNKYTNNNKHQFYFRAVGLNLYKIIVNDQCLCYNPDGDKISIQTCTESMKNERELFELYGNQDMEFLDENDESKGKAKTCSNMQQAEKATTTAA